MLARSRFHRRARSALLLFLGVAAAVGEAHAEAGNSAAAEALYVEAKGLVAAGRHQDACPKFEESQRLDPGSGTLINLAACYEHTRRLASAWTTYLEAAAASRGTGNAEREATAREFAAALVPRLSRLVVTVPQAARVPGLQVLRDDTPVGHALWNAAIPADEGKHVVVARAPGYEEWSTTVIVQGEGTTATATVPALAPAKGDTPGGSRLGVQRTAALVSGGVGVVGLGLGLAFGLRSKSLHDEASESCRGLRCPEATAAEAGNDAYTAGNIATVALIAGTAALAGGAVLWFTAPRATGRDEGVRVSAGPLGIAARGTF